MLKNEIKIHFKILGEKLELLRYFETRIFQPLPEKKGIKTKSRSRKSFVRYGLNIIYFDTVFSVEFFWRKSQDFPKTQDKRNLERKIYVQYKIKCISK